jgi:ActR/RegA family two-component response regulator
MVGSVAKRLLVVDDEPLVREMLRLTLSHDFEVTTADSGENALRLVKESSFPVVFLDLRMKGLSGIQTLKVLRSLDKEQRVVILTGHKTTETAIEALNLGAYGYLSKPCQAEQLRTVARQGYEEYLSIKSRTEEFRSKMEDIHDSFLGILCHEVNTPLNCIIGYSSLLADDLENPEQRDAIKEIFQSGHDLHKLFMEIIDYLGVALNPRGKALVEFDSAKLKLTLEREFTQQGITPIFLLGHQKIEGPIMGPERALQLLFRKLASGLSRFTSSATFQIDVEKNPSRRDLLRLFIGKTGLRKAAHSYGVNLANIFDSYASSGERTEVRPKGLGLDFATAKRLAHATGMELSCQTDRDGDYCFVIEVPVVLAE